MAKLNYIGDSLQAIAPFDFPLIVFRFTPSQKNKKQELFTSAELCNTLQVRKLITFTQAQKNARIALRQQCAFSQTHKAFSIDAFAKRMAQFIINRNSFKNAKRQIEENQAKVGQLMKSIRDVGIKQVQNKTVQVKTLRQLREEVEEKRIILQQKQDRLLDLQCDFKAVRDKFTEERSKEMH